MLRIPRRALAALLALVVLASCRDQDPNTPLSPGDAARSVEISSTPEVAVDFGAPVSGHRSLSGFLHGIGDALPGDSLIAPLRPTMWRIGKPSDYARLVRTFPDPASRPRVTFVLSDQWGYPSYDGSHGWPFEGKSDAANPYREWEDFVRRTAEEHRSKDVLWEVWNEPDIVPQFWGGTQAQFRETYLRAYRVLREVLGPGAQIGGPSYSSYSSWVNPQGVNTRDLMRDFLEFCSASGCRADFLTWHELHPEVPPIADHLEEIRALAAAYPEVGVRELHVAESVAEVNHYRPAEQLGTLYYLERGRADAAVKTCWNDSRGSLTCFNNAVDGVLAGKNLNRTAGWWAYKSYADGASSRVQGTTNHSYIVPLGSASGATAGQAQVLLAYMSYPGAPASASVRVSLGNVSLLPFVRGTSVRVRVQNIPNSGESAVRRLATAQDARHAIVNGSVQLSASVKVNEALLVTVEP